MKNFAIIITMSIIMIASAAVSDPTPIPLRDMGDVNGNGEVEIVDAGNIFKLYLGFEVADLRPDYLDYGDVDVNGQLTPEDALSVFYLAHVNNIGDADWPLPPHV